MIILDTCVLIFDALTPERLTTNAKRIIEKGELENSLFCSDISLWETAMLTQKKRLDPGTEIQIFLEMMLSARGIQVLPINIEIAAISTAHTKFNHYDPADRLIAATAMHYRAKLVTSDKKLAAISDLKVVW